MKDIFTGILALLISFGCLGQPTVSSAERVVHENKEYKFKVSVPKDWIETSGFASSSDTLNTDLQWMLPKTYSVSENKEIANSIYITAYNRVSITSIQKLIDVTFESFFNFHECRLEEDYADKNARIILCTRNKYKFKGKYYFVIKKNISYVISFKATEDTYDKNLPVFESFYKSIKFL